MIENAIDERCGKVDSDLLSRVTFSSGNMLKALPAAQSSRDIYLFIAIFHCMSDAQADHILINLRSAFWTHRPTIAIIETIAEAQHVDLTVASFDMQMLIGTRGRERTETEWGALLKRNGYEIREIVLLRTFARLLVVCKCS